LINFSPEGEGEWHEWQEQRYVATLGKSWPYGPAGNDIGNHIGGLRKTQKIQVLRPADCGASGYDDNLAGNCFCIANDCHGV